MEPCCYRFTMILAFMNFVDLISLNFTCLIYHGELFSMFAIVVPVITFFFHFSMVEFIPRILEPH